MAQKSVDVPNRLVALRHPGDVLKCSHREMRNQKPGPCDRGIPECAETTMEEQGGIYIAPAAASGPQGPFAAGAGKKPADICDRRDFAGLDTARALSAHPGLSVPPPFGDGNRRMSPLLTKLFLGRSGFFAEKHMSIRNEIWLYADAYCGHSANPAPDGMGTKRMRLRASGICSGRLGPHVEAERAAQTCEESVRASGARPGKRRRAGPAHSRGVRWGRLPSIGRNPTEKSLRKRTDDGASGGQAGARHHKSRGSVVIFAGIRS